MYEWIINVQAFILNDSKTIYLKLILIERNFKN